MTLQLGVNLDRGNLAQRLSSCSSGPLTAGFYCSPDYGAGPSSLDRATDWPFKGPSRGSSSIKTDAVKSVSMSSCGA